MVKNPASWYGVPFDKSSMFDEHFFVDDFE
jgi:hypothetical protein